MTVKQKKEPGTTTKTKKTKQSPTGREKELTKKLAEKQSEIEVLQDRLVRLAAEMDNMRKRQERECGRLRECANDELLKCLLPVLDDLDRSLKSLQQNKKNLETVAGVELIQRKLLAVLKEFGLEPMQSVGESFDVELHDALLQVEAEDQPPHMVLEEHEKGYLLHGRVLRHAKVVVSK